MNEKIKRFGNQAARRVQKFSDGWAARYWHDYPLGKTPRADRDAYLALWRAEKDAVYPAIDAFERDAGHAADAAWLHDLALHTQIVMKNSPLCYQHGRILYASLRAYIDARKGGDAPLTIFETGTARGFSSVVMARALRDSGRSGKIVTFDILPHGRAMYWNCIDDHEGAKTREALLAPWRDLVSPYILFVEGDSRIQLGKIAAGRINFAFLDGAHVYRDVMFEFGTIAARQQAGDVIVFDDYNEVDFPGLVRAVDEGCARMGYDKDIVSIGKDRSYVIARKKGGVS